MGYEITEPTDTTTTETTDVTTTTTSTEATTDTPSAGDTTTEGVVDKSTDENAGGDPAATEEGKPAEGDEKPEGEATEEVNEFYWGDSQVEIEISDDVSAALQEKGLDAMAIAKELYAKEGGFTLSEETRQKLNEAFGKFSVDAYLSGLKAQNEMFLISSQRDAEKAEQANAERYTQVAKEIGGDEGWQRLESFALEALSDEELAAFNEVMGSGNQYLQAYAVRELESRRNADQGDDKVTLISGNAAGAQGGGPITRQEYYAEMAQLSEKYRGDKAGHAQAQAALDARRRAGQAKGI